MHVDDRQVWKVIRHKDIQQNIWNFLWMASHDAYMVGLNWNRPGFLLEMQMRRFCTACKGQEESIEHIMGQCSA